MFHQVPVVGPIKSPSKESATVNTLASDKNPGRSVMDSREGIIGISTSLGPSSRTHEKEELQRLNDRFCAYIARVKLLNQHSNNVDSSAFLHSTKILEEEITNLKNIYENELDALRKEIEAGSVERSALHVQSNKQQKYIGDLQDRLAVETDKNSRLLDEINMLQRRIANLEAAVKDAHISAQRPQEEVEQLQRSVDNLTRETDQWKHRYEQELINSQQCEERLQQVLRKVEFSEQVHNQQMKDYQNRLEAAAATILSLEARLRKLSSADLSVNEVLKQVRDTAEAELRKYQVESEEQYFKNLSALKAQVDSEADTMQRFSQEKSELIGSIGELQAKIWNLEGQVANLQHQKQTLQETVTSVRKQGADNIQQLEKKLRDVQDMLVTKMFEVTSARESNIPLKAEIEALKVLLEEEETRLQVATSAAHTRMPQLPTASDILRTNSLSALMAATSSHRQPSASSYVQSLAESSRMANGGISPLYRDDSFYDYGTSHIPEGLHSGERGTLACDTGYERELTDDDLYKHEFALRETGPQYLYESSPSLSKLYIEPSPPSASRVVGPIQVRANSAPVKLEKDLGETNRLGGTKTREKKWNYIPASFGCGRDYFQDLQKQTLSSNPRPQSSSVERKMPSNFHDYTVPTSSATGDLKVLEVNEDGKYVKLVNDGPRELDIGRYILRQNVNGHAVAVFKFPPNVKILPTSTITVWSAMNDPHLHNPPTDFLWQEQEKWGTGPECSTILCRANGQAVAWTTAAHRHSTDVSEEASQSHLCFDEGRKALSVHYGMPSRTSRLYFSAPNKTLPEDASNCAEIESVTPDLLLIPSVTWRGVCRHAFMEMMTTFNTCFSHTKDEYGVDENVSLSTNDFVTSTAITQSDDINIRDDGGLIDHDMKFSRPRPELINLRREKQQPPLLSNAKQHQGSTSAFASSQTKQQQSMRNHKHGGPSAQHCDNMTVKEDRKPPTIHGNGTLFNKQAGSIYISPHAPYTLSLDKQQVEEPRDLGGYMAQFASQPES